MRDFSDVQKLVRKSDQFSTIKFLTFFPKNNVIEVWSREIYSNISGWIKRMFD